MRKLLLFGVLTLALGGLLAPHAEATTSSNRSCGMVNQHRMVCTYARADITAYGRLNATVWGENYASGAKVWLQLNVTNRTTGQLVWREYVSRTVPRAGAKVSYSVTVDCQPGSYLIQAWTWMAGSNVQPEAQVRVSSGWWG